MPHMTSQEVEAAVKADFQAFLDKWGAEISAEDHYPGYPECGEDVRMTITVPSVFSGENTREWTEIDLGRWVNCTKEVDNPNR